MSLRSIFSKSIVKDQRGFTLMELLIYTTITAIVVGVFSSILVVITRIQEQQSASIQVTSELNTMMNLIKSRVYNGASISVTDNVLTVSSATTTTAVIFLNEDGRLWLGDLAADDATPISSNKIELTEATFTELRSGSSAAVQIVLTATTRTDNPNRMVTRTLRATAAPLIQAQ